MQLPLLSLRKYCCLSRFFLAVLGFAALLHVLLFTSACLLNAPWLPSIGRLCWWLVLLDLLLVSTGLPGAAHATSFQLGWLVAAPCHLCPCLGRRQRPATAAAGLSRLDIFPGLFYVSFSLHPFLRCYDHSKLGKFLIF